MSWPPEPSVMGEDRKNAYRRLLYYAMLEIRTLCQSRGRPTYNPVEIYRQYVRSRGAGGLADWLHNLSYYASRDFEEFSEVSFWREYEHVRKKYTVLRMPSYRERFDSELARIDRDEVDFLFEVDHAFVVNGRGLTLAPGTWGLASARKGTKVEIRFSDGTSEKSSVVGIITRPKPAIEIESSAIPAEAYLNAEVWVIAESSSY